MTLHTDDIEALRKLAALDGHLNADDRELILRVCEAMKPLPPEILANALQDTAHREAGRGRAARKAKRKT